MEHLDFVIWILGWPMLPRKEESRYSTTGFVGNIAWLVAWLGIGALLYFT